MTPRDHLIASGLLCPAERGAPTRLGWVTHRPHEADCRVGACVAGCRSGEPWPTFRMGGDPEAIWREAERNDPAMQRFDRLLRGIRFGS
jgi:hypothetical protein